MTEGTSNGTLLEILLPALTNLEPDTTTDWLPLQWMGVEIPRLQAHELFRNLESVGGLVKRKSGEPSETSNMSLKLAEAEILLCVPTLRNFPPSIRSCDPNLHSEAPLVWRPYVGLSNEGDGS